MKKRALLVGIDDYPRPEERLFGCTRDVQRMAAVLAGTYGFEAADVRMLTGRAPTRAAIEAELAWLCEGSSPGEVCVFHYSGHGSQVADVDGDEPDGRDECIVPIDHEETGMLTDDRLSTFYRKVADGSNLTLVMDCCHSGTAQMAGPPVPTRRRFLRPSQAEEDAIFEASRRYSAARDAFVGAVLARHREADTSELERLAEASGLEFDRGRARTFDVTNEQRSLLLAACEAERASAEVDIDGEPSGCLTYYLLEAIERLGPSTPAAALLRRTAESIHAAGFVQIPRIEGKPEHKERPLFAPFT